MFDLIGGLPIHPLVVHAVVVLLPLAILGTLAIAAVPKWRRPYGLIVLVVAAAAAALVPVATESGEALEHRVGSPGEHAELGDQLIWFALPLVVLVAGLVYVDRRASIHRYVPSAVAVLAVLAAVAAGVQVYRVGDSGARAVWSDQVSSSQSSGSSGSDSDGGGK